MTKKNKDEINLAVMQTDIAYIKISVTALSNKIDDHYVTKDEFDPIKKLVYGLVSLILIAVVGAIVALVVQ